MVVKTKELDEGPIGEGVDGCWLLAGGSGKPAGFRGVAQARVMHSFSEPTMFHRIFANKEMNIGGRKVRQRMVRILE